MAYDTLQVMRQAVHGWRIQTHKHTCQHIFETIHFGTERQVHRIELPAGEMIAEATRAIGKEIQLVGRVKRSSVWNHIKAASDFLALYEKNWTDRSVSHREQSTFPSDACWPSG